MIGFTPVGAGPRFLCLTGFDFAITVLYTEGEPGGSANYAPGSDHKPDTLKGTGSWLLHSLPHARPAA